MAEAAKEAGVNLELDTDGLITNYTEAMTQVYKELDAAITAANKDGNADENEQEKIDAIQKRADDLQAAIDQYDETRTTIEDLNNQLDDKFYEWQDNNAEMLSYKLELKIEINDMELENLEYYLGKIEDDFYSMAEAAALMVNASTSMTGTSQLGVYQQELVDYSD
jgi:chromosome segregation ATPase